MMVEEDLFVVVSWGSHSQCFTSILQLERQGINHEYGPCSQEAPVVESEFSVNFRLPLVPPSLLPVQWGYALLTEAASLHMVPDWFKGAREEELHSCIFNLKTKKCKRVKPPHTRKYGGHVVSLGAHTYFFPQPCNKDTNKAAPIPVLERYDPLKDKWEKLEPIPQDFIAGCNIYMGTIRASALWDDTILLYLFESLFFAYNVGKNKWYRVMFNKPHYPYTPGDCVIEGEVIVIGDTIYALSPKYFDSVAIFTIHKKVVYNDDLVYKCSLVKIIEVPGEKDIEFDYEEGSNLSRHLLHLGEDKFCLVHSCRPNYREEYQHIQLTHMKLNIKRRGVKNSVTVTNKSVHQFKLEPNEQFQVTQCFTLPKRKAADLKQGQTSFDFDPFPQSFLSRLAPKYQDKTDINLERGLAKPSHAYKKASTLGVGGAALERSHSDEEGHSICVVKFSSEATVRQLMRGLQEYGPLMKVQIHAPTNKSSQRKPCACVEFESAAAKRLAIEASPFPIGGRQAVIRNIRRNDIPVVEQEVKVTEVVDQVLQDDSPPVVESYAAIVKRSPAPVPRKSQESGGRMIIKNHMLLLSILMIAFLGGVFWCSCLLNLH